MLLGEDDLASVVNRIVAHYDPNRVYLFGSYAKGTMTRGSDIDLLVTGPGAEQAPEAFVKHPKVHEVLGRGANKASVKFGLEGIQVDLRALPEDGGFGAPASIHCLRSTLSASEGRGCSSEGGMRLLRTFL